MKSLLRKALFALLLAGAAGLFSSCATEDSDPKPWLAPQPWETGPFPSGFNNGH
jgi:Spy/CpxP family protein refolding chaperone